MNKFIIAIPFFFLWIYTEAQTFEQMEQEATTAFRSQNFLQSAAIIDKAYPLFPDKHYSMTTDLAYIYMMAGEPEKSVDALARATAEGLWFVIDTTRHWKPLAAVNGLKPLMATWSARQSEKMAQSRMKLDVVLPKNYDAQKAWPLMLAFHGHGENTDFHKKYWHSGLTDSLFIVAFVQSSLVVGPDHYGWNDWDRSRREIAEAYRSVVANYHVDTLQVVATGFSWGATMAIDMTLNQRIPATSFIALCPGLPFPIADEQIKKAASLHVAGVIITGDADQSLPDQKRISRQMTNAGMNNSVMVSPAHGHWYPDDISRQIDLAIKSLHFYREK
ncbi:MAG: hypothetical protein PHQ65_04185 [Bacteroidales bacterium]|nr:hypothetical protein [Bacteroidales bacterium]MDD3664440.1 hypothetical protein [Bacteroidales bacterium]